MSTIVPPSADTQARDERILEASRLSRVDGCPEACGNYTLPLRVTDESYGFRAYYTCEDCGHSWATSWTDERVEWMR